MDMEGSGAGERVCKTINELCIGLSDVRYRPRIDAPFRGGDALLLSRAQMTCSPLVSHFSKVATDHCVEVGALPIVNPGRCLKNDKASWDALCCICSSGAFHGR